MAHVCNPSLGRQRQEDTWESPASWANLLSKVHDSEKPYTEIKKTLVPGVIVRSTHIHVFL